MKTLHSHISRLLNYRPGRLAQGTLAMTAGLGLRTLGQAGVFLIVARVLGVEAYGAYSAVLALAMTLGGFTGLGASVIMLRDTARDPVEFAASWGRTLGAWLVTAPGLFVVYLLLAWVILPERIGWVVIVCLGAAEILLTPLMLAGVQGYQGHERMGRAARIVLAPILPRLAAAVLLPLVLLMAPSARLSVWAVLYLIAAAFAVVYTLVLLHRDFGLRMAFHWRGLGYVLAEGWPFAVGGAAQKVYVDIDKIMLVRLTTLEITGAYSAAYRVVDMANVPLMSFFAAAAPRFFRAGGEGVRSAARYAWQVLPLPMLYALAVSVSMYLLAGLLPWVLGAGFAPAVEVLRWLAWLPLLTIPRRFGQTVLNASGGQAISLLMTLGGAVINIGLNAWLILLWSWRGAVVATYVAELVMIVCFYVSVARVSWYKGIL
ncbi:Membrane protein involved in the export of O-antigen and teichoic acid [Desulfacinum hydrothermale DSM 13146]|uniref:Membrane protein involved in the export of O-antigen and teichoic acid n=1 Tax=Desulfacinum hydrothermale DSM 13146 TaxID=1121390 RepID=A0A1W1XEW9_9BACT|nr:oligosaccharide flippase family protein [Desulfacinum hydrothermale]SMC22450.1 Membrane protein involved in the export of O-antigen and teichoic acid [Desulfacinum hydrothermale DSM 13146]